MSIHNGTEQVLALVQHEVDKAVAKARKDLARETESRIAALEQQHRFVEDSASAACRDLQHVLLSSEGNAKALAAAQSRLEMLCSTLENAGFAVETNTIKFGPLVSTLALDIQRLAGNSSELPTGSLLNNSVSGFGAVEILQAVKLSLEQNLQTLNTWRFKCEVAEEEQGALRAKTAETEAILASKVAEIENLHKEIVLLKSAENKPTFPSKTTGEFHVVSLFLINNSYFRQKTQSSYRGRMF